MNREQKEFAISIAKRLAEVVTVNDHYITVNEKMYSYEDFVVEYLDIKQDARVGMLKISTEGIRVLLPYTQGVAWFKESSMGHKNNHNGLSIVNVQEELVSLYGQTNLSNGFFSPYGRVKLYDKSWKKVELTLDQIAEKFDVKPEQIRIKK